jgi:Rieske Fe-S protein
MADLNRRQFVLAVTSTGAAAVCGCLAGCAASGDAGAPAWHGPTSFDLGPAVGIAKDGIDARWAQSGGFFVVRQAGKIHAMSAVCTHKSCDLAADGRELFCDCHNSHFGLEGQPRSGPARLALPRFGIAIDPAGRLHVDRTQVYPESRWNEPGAFVTL